MLDRDKRLNDEPEVDEEYEDDERGGAVVRVYRDVELLLLLLLLLPV